MFTTMPVFYAPPRARLKQFDRDRIARGSRLGPGGTIRGAFSRSCPPCHGGVAGVMRGALQGFAGLNLSAGGGLSLGRQLPKRYFPKKPHHKTRWGGGAFF